MTLDILICSLDKGVVRVQDVLLPPQDNVHYIVSYQYTDDRYLELIPKVLNKRDDVSIYTYKGKGLSANRNLALDQATSDIVMFADDDAHLLSDTPEKVIGCFEQHTELDVAFFCASTYTGKLLKNYPKEDFDVLAMPAQYTISALEMACRRRSVQGKIRFDERFGLGTKFLTCGEEEVWLEDALVYVDAGVQRSRGAIDYYMLGHRAWWSCFCFALRSAKKGYCHFLPMMRHLAEGIRYMKRTSK